MSILSSTNVGKHQKLTMNYLINVLHLIPINYAKDPVPVGNFSIDFETGANKNDKIDMIKDEFRYAVNIQGIQYVKRVKTIGDADKIYRFWKAKTFTEKCEAIFAVINELENMVGVEPIQLKRKKR